MGALALLLALAASGGAKEVSLLTRANFEASVLHKPLQMWLVYFHAPWCGHCKRLAPVFQEVADEPEVEAVRFGKVDATVGEPRLS